MRRTVPQDLSGTVQVLDGVEWIGSTGELEAWVSRVENEPAMALDTEFHRERSYFPKLCLVQAAVADEVVLIDPLACDLSPLGRLFTRKSMEFVFHASEQDLEILERAVGIRPARIFDTQIAAALAGTPRASLVSLVAQYCGVKLSKEARLSDWTVRPLSVAQIAYAACDVYYLIELRNRLGGILAHLGRDGWALEDMEFARELRRNPPDGPESLRRIREVRTLDAIGRALARDLAHWREDCARERDIPARFVLSDEALVAIARARPTSLEALFSLREVTERRFGRPHGAKVIELVEGAAAVREDPVLCPREDCPPGSLPLSHLVGAVVSAFAERAGIEPTLVASNDDVAAFVQSRSGPLATGWRYAQVGQDILRLLEGQASLVVEGGELSILPRWPQVHAKGEDAVFE